MNRFKESFRLLVLLATGLSACRDAGRELQWREDGMLNRLVDEYCSERFRFYPVEATLRGHHGADGQLGDITPDAFRKRRIWLRDFRQRLLGVDVTRLSQPTYLDLLLLTSVVKAEDYELTLVKSWKHSPAYYTKAIRSGLAGLLRTESMADAQLRALVSRLDQIPSFLEQARKNLEAAPRVAIEAALSDLEGCRRWVEELPALLKERVDSRSLAGLGVKSRDAVRALQSFGAHLRTKLLPEASTRFAMGSRNLRRLLLYEEMVDLPLGELRQEAERAVEKARSRMEENALLVESSGSLATVLGRLDVDRLAASEMLPLMRQTLDEVRAFAEERRLIKVSMEQPLRIVEAPPYLRSRSPRMLSTLDLSGNGSQSTLFVVAFPQRVRATSQGEDHLWPWNRRELQTAVLRELYPGKALYDTALLKSKRPLRQLVGSLAHREGWGLYMEEEVLAGGYRWEDPLLQMVQLRDELIEQCRLITAVDLHTGAEDIEGAARRFREMALLSSKQARREAQRVAVNPRWWSAALGKLQILRLRESALGNDATPGAISDFHDSLLESAGLPLRLVEVRRRR